MGQMFLYDLYQVELGSDDLAEKYQFCNILL